MHSNLILCNATDSLVDASSSRSISYGLKSWEETPIDIVEDDGCSSMPTVEGFYSLRSPDAIKLVTVGEDIYIITANEVSSLVRNVYPFICRHHII